MLNMIFKINSADAQIFVHRNLVRRTRSSQLQSIDNSESKSVFLGREGQDFDFSHLKQNVQVLGCSAKANDLKNLADWIASA